MDLNYIFFQFPDLPKVVCLFQGRSTAPGNSGNISFQIGACHNEAIAARKQLFAILAKKGLTAWRECRQFHGDGIISEPMRSHAQADGMMTSRKGLGLMIKTADCQPLFLAHKSGKHIMALHVGWRGNRMNFPASAVKRFCGHYGLKPQDLLAVRGPSLGPAAAEFINFETEWGETFKKWYQPATRCMDLWGLTKWQLQEVGVPSEQIYGVDICTLLNSDKYFSYRKDKNLGRQASVIWIDAFAD